MFNTRATKSNTRVLEALNPSFYLLEASFHLSKAYPHLHELSIHLPKVCFHLRKASVHKPNLSCELAQLLEDLIELNLEGIGRYVRDERDFVRGRGNMLAECHKVRLSCHSCRGMMMNMSIFDLQPRLVTSTDPALCPR
jgi:hypothetical protein